MSSTDFLKAINDKFKKINPDIVYDKNKKIDFIKTGCFSFDLQVGGFPRDRLSEIFGMEGSGKSSLLHSTAARLQKEGGLSVYLDLEGSFNHDFAKKAFGLTVDPNTFILLQPSNADEADSILHMIEKELPKIDAIFIDSIAGLISKEALEKSIDDPQKIGSHAQVVGRIIPKLVNLARKKNCAIILVNQLRAAMNINPYGPKSGLGNMGGGDYKTTGGESPKFYMSLRIYLTNKSINDEDDKKLRLGFDTIFAIKKSRVGTPHIEFKARFNLEINGQTPGWNKNQDLISLGKDYGIIEQKGPKFIYHGSSPELSFEVQGKDHGMNMLLSDLDRKKDLENRIISSFKSKKESGAFKISNSINPEEFDENDDDSIPSIQRAGEVCI